MANKKVEIMIDDTRIVAELYVDKAPEICSMILGNPGQRAVVQHAKLNGQLIFGTLPYPCGFENKCRGGDLDMFDLAYYPPLPAVHPLRRVYGRAFAHQPHRPYY